MLKNHQHEVRNIMKSEIYCDDEWASIGVTTSIDLIEQSAYLLTAGTMSGTIPHTQPEGSYGLVFTRPLGVVLGIAPWNSPLFLALRAVIAPLATGNTVILKVMILFLMPGSTILISANCRGLSLVLGRITSSLGYLQKLGSLQVSSISFSTDLKMPLR